MIAHARVYGHSTRIPAKIVNLRTVHRSRTGSVAAGATTKGAAKPPITRRIRVASGTVEAAIWDRDSIGAGEKIAGPAIVEQSDTTTLVEPGWTARLTDSGALLLERTP